MTQFYRSSSVSRPFIFTFRAILHSAAALRGRLTISTYIYALLTKAKDACSLAFCCFPVSWSNLLIQRRSLNADRRKNIPIDPLAGWKSDPLSSPASIMFSVSNNILNRLQDRLYSRFVFQKVEDWRKGLHIHSIN